MVLVALALASSMAGNGQVTEAHSLKSKTLYNPAAYIPAQCYTKTQKTKGQSFNPCYVCHTQGIAPNFLNDEDLQLELSFQKRFKKNHWQNHFIDRSAAIDKMENQEIQKYIRSSNYLSEQQQITLANKLNPPPQEWDFDEDGQWSGYIPDAYFNFDEQGFDLDFQGNFTGWRAFAYYPLPGAFAPANGSTDDVLIRLPKIFQLNNKGKLDYTIYQINLAVLEAFIKQKDISITPVNEAIYQTDLNGNDVYDTANIIKFRWHLAKQITTLFVGAAGSQQKSGQLKIAPGLFPIGTEFLHSVRYIDFDDKQHVQLSPRLKELRHAKKTHWFTYAELQTAPLHEVAEREAFPDRLKSVHGDLERGVSNNFGWRLQGFIEDQRGELRPQTYEEQVFCVGCHSTIGTVTDGTFSFARKLSSQGFQQGWYHWSQKSIKHITDPEREDGKTEYAFYLKQAKGGDEFRSNGEVESLFFNSKDNTRYHLNAQAVEQLKKDISTLLWPSKDRALQLNKAYKLIVEEQSYIFGRSPVITPQQNLHRKVLSTDTGIKATVIATPLK